MPWKSAPGGDGQKSRAASKSIRGQISAPIPISDPLDEEFPMRNQTLRTTGTAEATPSDTDLIPQESSNNNQGQHKTDLRTTSVGNAEPLITRYHQQPDISSSFSARTSTMRKSSASQPSRFTRVLDQEDGRDSQASQASQASQPQRKKSTIRSALGKIFGRKKKTEMREKVGVSGRKTPINSGFLPNKQHRSDPTWGHSNQLSIEPKRSFSVPITEYDRALRSHSISPEDVKAITSARNSINADLRLTGKDFALFGPPTLPASPRWAGGSKLAGLSPRPASSQDRGTRMAGPNYDPSEIGRAISSEARGLKRRSRSLSVMPSLEIASQGVVRRRSAEIRYWRESYAAPLMSPLSSAAEEEIRSMLRGDAGESGSSIEQRAVAADHIILVEAVESQAQTPTPADVAEPAEAAGRLSQDGRVNSLETRMSRLEGIVLQLGQSITALRQPSSTQKRSTGGQQQARLQTPDQIMRSMQIQPGDFGLTDEPQQSTSRPSTRHSDASKMTFGDVSDTTPRATILSSGDKEARSALLAAPRGIDAISRNRHGSLTFEHYTNLMALLETERSARSSLEAQVRSLGRQIQVMSKSMVYTTDRSDSPSLDKSLGEVSVFDHDDDDGNERRHRTGPSCGYTGLGMEDSGIATGDRSDDEYTGVFVKPVETGKSSFDMYGNENDPMLSNGRKLSLSHLTMRQPLTTMQQVAAKAV
ncbi:hypothetical protein NOR_04553 [Metarhizium rileyi]|uniref:Uncharacterized protein n=1 Tax=Metarhizium rileyi (strain RCEF 4871) TaxID=1649241 RepID=A0A167E1R0_METRR|nr:hypothetical protein NOR_04553 [Metarhizium rileyi RCEF 4871]TWU76834.1 hypothetical protein ED733_005957 [Metarhizium rileyi]